MLQNIVNTASITYNGNPLPPTCPVVTTVQSNMGIYKSAITSNGTYVDNSADNLIGDDNLVRYQVQLINYSSQDFTEVVLNDEIVLPDGVTANQLTFLAPPQSSYANEETLPKIKFTLPNVPANSSLVVFYTIAFDDSIELETVFENQANVDYKENCTGGPIESNLVGVVYNNTKTKVVATKEGPDSVFCDEVFDYVLAFKNTGRKVAKNVIVTDYLPSEFVLDAVKVENDGTVLHEDVDYTYSVDDATNVLTIQSIGDALNIQPDTTLIVTISGSVPCGE